jgi:alpha-tubulin suppressor-like RCC1 family protein
MTWGNDEFGQLGIGSRSLDEEGRKEEDTVMLKHTSRGKRLGKDKLFPRDILWSGGKIGSSISKIFASAQTSFIKLADDTMYGCGLNNFGQIGQGTTSVHPVRIFTKIEALSEKKISLICGGTVHCAALTEHGNVLSWGRSDYSGSHHSDKDIQPPKEIPSIKDISHLACGGSHTLAVTGNGQVFAWGFGGTHQLGNLPRDISMGAAGPDEEPQDEQEPYLIQSKQLAERHVLMVGAGAQHSVELAFNGQYAQPLALAETPGTPASKSAKKRRLAE